MNQIDHDTVRVECFDDFCRLSCKHRLFGFLPGSHDFKSVILQCRNRKVHPFRVQVNIFSITVLFTSLTTHFDLSQCLLTFNYHKLRHLVHLVWRLLLELKMFQLKLPWNKVDFTYLSEKNIFGTLFWNHHKWQNVKQQSLNNSMFQKLLSMWTAQRKNATSNARMEMFQHLYGQMERKFQKVLSSVKEDQTGSHEQVKSHVRNNVIFLNKLIKKSSFIES